MIEATLKQIAAATSITKRGIQHRAEREKWAFQEQTGRGGKRRVYTVATLPTDIQAALAMANAPAPAAEPTNELGYNRDAIYVEHAQRPAHLREQGERRAAIVRQVKALQLQQFSFTVSLRQVATANDESPRTIERWCYATEGFHEADWAAVLTPAYKGRQKRSELPPQAWDFFIGHYLTRKQPTFKESFRRLAELAKKNGWTLPASRTLANWVEEIPLPTRVLAREGEEALAKRFPPQRRDKSVFAAGEAVTGDGLKFDKLWVLWEDGEILNTSTGWFWGDIRTNKILAYRLAKTENTDMFRLATYDLTAICRPTYAWVDNTVVAANKAMTGRSGNRHRFHDKHNDPIGLLQTIGMDVRFTNPDKVMGSPGAKPIERSFGVGGIHELVATSPRLKGKGYSKATAIAFELFASVVAEEVQRFNARTGRRTAACRGSLSFDAAFAESFKTASVVKLPESQRRILLLMPEVVRFDSRSGEIKLKAGRGPMGKHRFWNEECLEHLGEEAIAYYDPENIAGSALALYSMDGRYICDAGHLGDVAFNDTVSAREHNKNKSRFMKAQKLAAAAELRMTELEVAAMYPEQDAPASIPQPGVVRGNFGQKKVVRNLGAEPTAEQMAEVRELVTATERPVETEEQRFARWYRLDQARAQGGALAAADQGFLQGYEQTAEFEARKELLDRFGPQGIGLEVAEALSA